MTVKKFNDKLTAKVHKWLFLAIVRQNYDWWNRFYGSGLKTVKKMKGEKTLAQSISLHVKKWMIWVDGVVNATILIRVSSSCRSV